MHSVRLRKEDFLTGLRKSLFLADRIVASEAVLDDEGKRGEYSEFIVPSYATLGFTQNNRKNKQTVSFQTLPLTMKIV